VNQTPAKPQARLRLHRSAHNRMIAGVCGGLADSFGVDPLLVRVAALFLLIPLHVFLVLLYLALAILLPVED
jgi:phage shock protein C